MNFVEQYLAHTSMYWAMKYFTIALIPADNEFWMCKEKPFPNLLNTKVIPSANFVIKRNEEHIIAYCGGIKPRPKHIPKHAHGECKYNKFAYSSYFGFNVPLSQVEFDFSAFDCMLAISEDDNYFRHRLGSDKTVVMEDYIYSSWKVYNDVTIETYIILLDDFESHIRVHFIDAGRNINAIETGFSIGLEKVNETIDLITDDTNGLTYKTKYAYTHIYPLFNGEIFKFRPANNSNIISPRVYTPAVKWELEKGTHIVGAFFSANKGMPIFETPTIKINDSIEVTYKQKEYKVKLVK